MMVPSTIYPVPTTRLSAFEFAGNTENALDQQDHLALVKGAMSRTLDRAGRRTLYEYTYTHVTEANLRADALLHIADIAIDGARERMGSYDWPRSPRTEDRAAFFEAKAVAEDVLDHAALIDDRSLILAGHYLVVSRLGSLEHPEEPGSLVALEVGYKAELASRGFVGSPPRFSPTG